MRFSLAVIALSFFASQHAAADGVKVDFQVSPDGNLWADAINASPGDSVFCRILCGWGLAAGAWTSLSLSELRFNGTLAGDAAANFGGLLLPPTQTLGLINPGAVLATIDRTDVPAGDIQFGISIDHIPGNPVVLLSFRFTLDAAPGARIVGWNDDHDAVTAATINFGNGDVPFDLNKVSLDGARINVTPAPATLIPLAAAVAIRRRRRI